MALAIEYDVTPDGQIDLVALINAVEVDDARGSSVRLRSLGCSVHVKTAMTPTHAEPSPVNRELPLQELAALVRLPVRSPLVERALAARARKLGASWDAIGAAAGMPPWVAETRWGRRR